MGICLLMYSALIFFSYFLLYNVLFLNVYSNRYVLFFSILWVRSLSRIYLGSFVVLYGVGLGDSLVVFSWSRCRVGRFRSVLFMFGILALLFYRVFFFRGVLFWVFWLEFFYSWVVRVFRREEVEVVSFFMFEFGSFRMVFLL